MQADWGAAVWSPAEPEKPNTQLPAQTVGQVPTGSTGTLKYRLSIGTYGCPGAFTNMRASVTNQLGWRIMPRRAVSTPGLRGGEGLEECCQIHGLETKNGIRDGSVGCGAHPKDVFITRAAVTRDHRLGGLHCRHFFLMKAHITAPREEAGSGGQRKDLEGDILERVGSFPELRPPHKCVAITSPLCLTMPPFWSIVQT